MSEILERVEGQVRLAELVGRPAGRISRSDYASWPRACRRSSILVLSVSLVLAVSHCSMPRLEGSDDSSGSICGA